MQLVAVEQEREGDGARVREVFVIQAQQENTRGRADGERTCSSGALTNVSLSELLPLMVS